MCDTEERRDPNHSRWNHLRNILGRRGMFNQEEFIPDEEILDFMLNDLKILVIGAGGLGCEVLKDLTLTGLLNIHVIDMDVIDLSNLNRQFLFRQCDIGKSKAEVAAAFINQRVPGANVKPHFCKIQDYDASFYQDFHIVVCGVDSILARRWINGMLLSLLEYDSDGNLDQSSVRILIDGGTEGFKGNVRVITPGMSACLECTLDLYPPQINYPMCTIAHTPRQPEHCVEYVKMFLWEKEDPFGGLPIDGDNPEHIEWIFNSAQVRAREYGITGVTYRLTQGVIKRIIPAVASTNAVIAAACVNEVFKVATQCYTPMNNYMVFNDVNGVYTYTFAAEKLQTCLLCSNKPRTLNFTSDAQLRQLLDHLKNDPTLQMENPSLTTMIGGRNKTLYIANIPSIEEATRPNLSKSLKDLGVEDGCELICADVTNPSAMRFNIHFTDADYTDASSTDARKRKLEAGEEVGECGKRQVLVSETL